MSGNFAKHIYLTADHLTKKLIKVIRKKKVSQIDLQKYRWEQAHYASFPWLKKSNCSSHCLWSCIWCQQKQNLKLTFVLYTARAIAFSEPGCCSDGFQIGKISNDMIQGQDYVRRTVLVEVRKLRFSFNIFFLSFNLLIRKNYFFVVCLVYFCNVFLRLFSCCHPVYSQKACPENTPTVFSSVQMVSVNHF